MFLKEKFDLPIVEIPQPLEPWRQVLLDAAQRLRERGWCQGSYMASQSDSVCMLGAIALASGWDGGHLGPLEDPPMNGDATIAIEDALGQIPFIWNDAPGRTAEEVISTLEKVARS